MADTKTKAPADAEPKTCACGCGEPVVRSFKQGHDQRLVAKLARDLVYMDVWDGKCMSILRLKDVRGDQEEKINKVADYVRSKLSDALGEKVYRAAMRTWELEKTRGVRAEKKAAAKAAKADKPKRSRKAVTSALRPDTTAASEEATAVKEPKLITKAAASNDDVDAAEAAMESGAALGATVRVKVGRRERNATVHGMNQAGKVTAIRYKVGNNEITKTEGQFEVV